ncbi:MAG: fatty acyl-AMP ligase [Chloroflexota bacterium]
MSTLVDRLYEHRARHPDSLALALVLHDREETFTVGDFVARAECYANQLRVRGIGRGDLVILVIGHGEALVFSFWGALLLGAVPSIFPFLSDRLDPEHYYRNVRQLVERSEARAIIVGDAQREALEHALAGLPVPLIDAGELATITPPTDSMSEITPAAAPDDTAFLQHSSGSTGLQKGVMLSHRAVLNQIEAYSGAIGLRADDVVVSWLPLYHDMGLIAGFVMPLTAGVPLVLMSPFHWVRDPQILLHAIHRYRGTLCWLPNFAYNFLATRVRDSQIEGLDLSSWRAAINCSEPVAAASHRQFVQRFAPYGFQEAALSVCYAMAENTFAVTQTRLPGPPRIDRIDARMLRAAHRAVPASQDGAALEVVSCGQAIDGCEVRVVLPDGTDAPERQIGEIAIRSNSMLSGYYRQPELTAQSLRDGWYFTGDLGYLAGGELFVTGRRKDLIIVGGKNIYPQDIETIVNEISGVHPGRVAAFGVANERLGTEDIAVVAEVETSDPDRLGEIERQIRTFVAQRLDVTVRYVRLTGLRWLVKTSSGKVSRSATREKFLADFCQFVQQ